jgi:predicted phage terminase large subunit-like protein
MNDDMAGWLAQYQQQPIERDGAVFNPESLKYYSELPGEEPVKIIAHCDVALGGSDFLSFPIAYYFENPDGSLSGYVEDVVFDKSEKHVTQPQVVGKIKKHHIRNVHFEANQGGEGYKDDVIRLLKADKEYNEPCNITSSWAPVTKRKEQRIWDCAQEIRELYFKEPSKRDDQYRKFMQNLYSFTMNMKKRDHDDAPDSLAGLVDFARSGSGVKTARIIGSIL